jgi:hypothetical protein
VKPHGVSRAIAGAALSTIAALALSARDARAHLGNLSYSEIDIRGAQALMRLKFAAHLIPGSRSTKRATSTVARSSAASRKSSAGSPAR